MTSISCLNPNTSPNLNVPNYLFSNLKSAIEFIKK